MEWSEGNVVRFLSLKLMLVATSPCLKLCLRPMRLEFYGSMQAQGVCIDSSLALIFAGNLSENS